MIKNIFKIIKYILLFFLIIVVLFNLYMLFQNFVLKSELPDFFGYSYLEIKTGSMVPTYNIGDIVITKKNNDFSIGDVALYKDNNSFVMHRIIDIKENSYIFQGDANNTSEEVSKDFVIAKVVYSNKLLTNIISILRNRVVIILLVILIIILMFI